MKNIADDRDETETTGQDKKKKARIQINRYARDHSPVIEEFRSQSLRCHHPSLSSPPIYMPSSTASLGGAKLAQEVLNLLCLCLNSPL